MAPSRPLAARSTLARPVQRKARATQQAPTFEGDSDDELFPGAADPNGVSEHDLIDLQNISERVGAEVDMFAETLDQFRLQLADPASQRDAALKLCCSYRDYALDKVKALKKQTQIRLLHENRASFTHAAANPFLGNTGMADPSRQEEERDAQHRSVRHWQAEADTWDLFQIILRSRYSAAEEEEARKARLKELGQPHKYADNDQIWQSFILGDDSARERHLILKWLEQVAAAEESIKRVTSPDSGKKHEAVWTNGWMETREKLNGAKRMRMGNTGPVDVRRSDGSDLLVSALDPDAPARQKRVLEKADQISERTMWLTCFDMLRQGKPWAEICAWCTERNQGWKAISMGLAHGKEYPIPGVGVSSGALFRRMCLIAARSPAADASEAAVYGLLAGDLDTPRKACRSWNDHVYVHYNSMLIAQYDRYVLSFNPLLLSMDFIRKHGISEICSQGAAFAPDAIIASLFLNTNVSKEATSAWKLVQGSLIGGTFHDLCLRTGAAIAEEVPKPDYSMIIKPIKRQDPGQLAELAIARHPDVLRIVTHILIVMKHLDVGFEMRDELDNIIAGYIQLLRSVSKVDETVIYGSMMTPKRCVLSLAQVLADSQDPTDVMDFLKLAKVYNMDSVEIIVGQFGYQFGKVINTGTLQRFKLLEETTERVQYYPGGRRINLEALDIPLNADEVALVNSLDTFNLIDGQWTKTFFVLASACCQLLVLDQFHIVRAVVEKVDFEVLSQTKSVHILGRGINVMEPEDYQPVCTDREQMLKLQQMQKESRTYYDVTVLVKAVNKLLVWRELEQGYSSGKTFSPAARLRLREEMDEMDWAMKILHSGVFTDPANEIEDSWLSRIKATYLPEITLAYLTALGSAGGLITRTALTFALEMANVVASDEKSGLEDAFKEAGRMGELVTMFAELSKMLLRVNHQHEKVEMNRSTRGHERKALGIWDITEAKASK